MFYIWAVYMKSEIYIRYCIMITNVIVYTAHITLFCNEKWVGIDKNCIFELDIIMKMLIFIDISIYKR